MAIDNVDVSGQRNVDYAKGIHKDRIIRAYRNKGVPLKNLILRLYRMSRANGIVTNANTRNEPLSVVVEHLPLSEDDKLVQLEIDGGGTNVQDIILYKEVVMTK